MTALAEWIGREERFSERIELGPIRRLAALMDVAPPHPAEGDAAAPLRHWLSFLPEAPHSQIGADGHPARGGFLPPVDLPRRMFAGARLSFHAPLVIGQPATRHASIADVKEKTGGSGRLVFVTVRLRFSQGEALCVEEEQDIVYREEGALVPLPEVLPCPELDAATTFRELTPDPVMLFRFSALTFNGHRIHYDLPYAREVEGYPALVVHGPLTATLLADLARAEGGELASFSFRGRAPLFCGQPLRLEARREGDGLKLVARRCDGVEAMTAEAGLRS